MKKELKNKGYLYSNLENKTINFKDIPLKEYPRINMIRDSYLCLNGEWDISIVKDSEKYNFIGKKCIVPFAIESPLSKVNHLLEIDETIYYKKEIVLDDEIFNKDLILLHFDGVDQIAEVYINSNLAFKHIGGYTKFNFDIKPYLTSKKVEILVKVKDVSDTSYHMRGKQQLVTSGWFYSSSSGIYKPVWIEGVSKNYIQSVKFKPIVDKSVVKVFIKTSVNGVATLEINNKEYIVKTNQEDEIILENMHLWDVNDPYLYYANITFFDDKIKTYFGCRKIEVVKTKKEQAIYLNNKRLFINGLLDQGYYYLGGLTPSSYDDYLTDIKNVKRLGFNCLRKHIKIEMDYFYYYCDKEGILLIQDFPCGGTPYKFINVVLPRVSIKLFNKEKYCTYKKYGREDKEGREEFKKEIKEIIDDTYNYPSILIYTIFNEAWGQFDASIIYKNLKENDEIHLYDSTSGWLDTKGNSDIFSIHSYTVPSKRRKDKYLRPYVLTEIGGASLVISDHYFYPKVFGHHKAKTSLDLERYYLKLYKKLSKRMLNGELNGTIYTQLNDCECECNGLYTLDRKVLKINEAALIELNNKINTVYKN